MYEKISRICGPSCKSRDTCGLVSRIVNQEARSRRRYDSRGDKELPGTERKKTLLTRGETCSGRPESSTDSRIRLIAGRSVAVPTTRGTGGSDLVRLNPLQFALDAFADSREESPVDDSFVAGLSHVCCFSRIHSSNMNNDV